MNPFLHIHNLRRDLSNLLIVSLIDLSDDYLYHQNLKKVFIGRQIGDLSRNHVG